MTLALLALAVVAPALVADKQSQGWHLGMPVGFDIQLPRAFGGSGPDAPAAKSAAKVYLVAPIDESVAFTRDMLLDTPRGETLLPAHQDVVEVCATSPEGVDTDGYFVVAGPRGNAATVKVRPLQNPAASVSKAALAEAVRIGPAWVPLTSHVVIERGVLIGHLKVVRFMYGGKLRLRGLDGTAIVCAT